MKSAGGSNLIEINGHLYDAKTGLPVDSEKPSKPKAQKKSPASNQSPKVVDGFSKPQKPARPKPQRTQVSISEPKPEPAKPAAKPNGAKSVHSKQQKSVTLQRNHEDKPKIQPRAKSSANSTPETPTVNAKATEERAQRANTVKQSAAISKFSSSNHEPTTAQPKSENIQHAGKVIQPHTQPEVRKIETAKKAPLSKKEELIAKQLSQTTNEPAKPVKEPKNRKRAMSIMATTVFALVFGGYLVYLNIPNLALKVAASRAGFEAQMPGYQPNGFGFAGPVEYSPGEITMKFDSRTDNRYFILTEKQTSWDSQSLLDNYVSEENRLYQTYQERGLTIFVYEGSNASWVNGGIWYTIEGDSLLSSEQLVKIATSL